MESSSEGQQMDSFLASMSDFVPTIPDEVTSHYLRRVGFVSPDVRLTRLISLTAQKFISDVAFDALQYCKIRNQSSQFKDRAKGTGKDKRLVLLVEDLASSLKEYGINVKKPEYFTDNVDTAKIGTRSSNGQVADGKRLVSKLSPSKASLSKSKGKKVIKGKAAKKLAK